MSEAGRRPCPVCGEMIMASAKVCRFCGEQFASSVSARKAKNEGDATGGVIPYKNMPALLAYYFGVFSIIPCFPLGIAALVLGIVGLRKAKREPHVKGQVHAWIGILAGGFFAALWLAMTVLGVASGIVAEKFGR
ncbi:MAG TPA: DUF4190 domain-containing protein [Planctomycetaceae bacterium]|nr:DUF4190 domain-containing protein [Planctomycetaceae bacterium]